MAAKIFEPSASKGPSRRIQQGQEREAPSKMPVFPGFDAMLILWGLGVLAYATVQHVWFGGARLDAPKRGK